MQQALLMICSAGMGKTLEESNVSQVMMEKEWAGWTGHAHTNVACIG